ncbi:MAG: hypothetical protein AUH85_03610 [Chloroflexi bacterium 13_1_40CM_4_68_4]|nr:MAG: hypothetical protein AUH85_03610 [Chloroflexi bacterium 13_1_40CM_4_68_4]
MSALDLIQLISNLVYVALAAITISGAIRRPTRANVDIALLFGALGFAVIEGRLQAYFGFTSELWSDLTAALVMSLPYLLLRLVDDFGHVRVAVKRAAAVGLTLSIVAILISGTPIPGPVTLALIGYFVVFATYAGVAFIPMAIRSQGVTRRRMQAISFGSLLLGLVILVAGVAIVAPQAAGLSSALVQVLALVAAVSWLVGFAPPTRLRRLWQEPELRSFLARASSVARLPDERELVRTLEDGAARTAGVKAAIGLWDEAGGVMRFVVNGEEIARKAEEFFAWPAFKSGRTVFSGDLAGERPRVAAAPPGATVEAAIAAPITVEARRLGVLVLYSDRAPIFAEDDVALAQLLADDSAIVLESRRLTHEAAEARAKEEAARLKEDFMSAAAHDLKTPLTTLVAQAQTLERRMRSGIPPDRAGIERITREAKRLQRLVEEMLEASRIDQGPLQLQRELIDVGEIAAEVVARHPDGERIRVDASGPTRGLYDRARLERLIENLIENAVKYSPPGAPIEVRLCRQGAELLLAVTDRGIGIPPRDRERIFQRFERAANVDDRSYPGTGLGLYICRGIAEGHGGRIWVESEIDAGSTFFVALPATEGAMN